MIYRKLSYWFVIITTSLTGLVIMGLGLAQAQGGIFVDTGQEIDNIQESLDVALADFDNDGDLDAFVVNGSQQSNQLWFNQSNGLYSPGSQTPGESTSQAIAVGDLDGDKNIDAFVANDGPNMIWFNAGDGAFFNQSGSTEGLGDSNSQGVAVGLLDGDALTDTIVANNGPNVIWINQGSGVFSTTVPTLGTANSQDVALADFNDDGKLDLFVANDGPNTVWLNKGDGTFTDTLQSLGNMNSRAVSVGDLDGDEDIDVLVANRGDYNVIWFNDGQGNFSRDAQGTIDPQNFGVGFNEDAMLHDLDGDGDLDAFIVAEATPDQVWLNDGTGKFSDSGQSLGNGASYGMAIGDINNDGTPDAFVVNKEESHKVWLNFGKLDVVRVRMTPAPVSDQAKKYSSIVVPYADTENIPNDGKLMVHGHQSGQLSENSSTIGPRSITYTAATPFKAGELVQVSTFTDSSNTDAYVWQFWGQTEGGVGKFVAGIATSDSGASHNDVAIGDLNGDGSLDAFVVLDGGNRVWKNNGSATMTPFGDDMGSSNSNAVALGDFNGDGYLDAVVANGRNDKISQPNQVWMNDKTGKFTNSGQNLGSSNSQGVAVGDLDGDGDMDIFVGNGWNPTTISPPRGHRNVVWLNNGAGGFSEGQIMNDYTSASSVNLADFDEDGDLDAFVTNDNQLNDTDQRYDQLWINDGQGQFSQASHVFEGSQNANSTSAAWGDINNDSYLDLIIGNEIGVNQIWLNNGPQGDYGLGNRVTNSADFKFMPNQLIFSTFSNWTKDVGFGDFNNDGCLDLVLVTDGFSTRQFDTYGLIYANVCEQRLIPTTDFGDYATDPIYMNLLAVLAPASQMQAVQVGDMDGDGDLDVFVASATDSDRVWINQDDIKVIRTDPPQNGRTIAANTNQVEVEFSRGIDSSSVNATTFSVWGQQTGYFEANEYKFPITSTMRLVKPDDPKFKPGELIFGGVQKVIADDEVVLPIPHMWQFWGKAIGGSGVFKKMQDIPSTYNSQDIALANIDGDPNGWIDAFVANRDGPNQIYQNGRVKPDIFLDSSPTTLPGNTQSNGVALADFNRDGDMDALVANTGENEFVPDVFSRHAIATPSYPITTTFDSRDVAVGDFGSFELEDGKLVLAAADGYLDAVFVNYGADNHVWINDQAGGFISHTLSSTNKNSQGVVVGDVSNDGQLDIIIANDGSNEVWLGNGLGGFKFSNRREHIPSNNNGNSTDVALADFNGNGFLDLVVVNADGADYVWFNDELGKGNFQEKNRVTLPDSDSVISNGVEVIDVEGDDDFDIFVAANGANRVWLNEPCDPKGPFINGEPLPPPLMGDTINADSQAVAVGDIDQLDDDGNQDIDVFVVNNGTANRVWENVPWPRFIIKKSVEPATIVQPGDELTYTITITNVGEEPATNLVVTDVIPAGAIFKDNQAIMQDGVAQLESDEITEVSFSVTVDEVTNEIVNEDYRVTSKEITMGRSCNSVRSEVQIPIEELTVIGPITGFIGIDYHFTVQISPTYATTPFVYRWQSNGMQNGPTEVFSQSLTENLATISWDTEDKTGLQPITITVQGANEIVKVHYITLTTGAVNQVHIEGPTSVEARQPYTFTAKAKPLEAATPITYIWEATNQEITEIYTSSTLSHAIPLTWMKAGIKLITVTANNMDGSAVGTHTITTTVFGCQPITGALLSRLSSDQLTTDTKVQFKVNITEGDPFLYTWTLDGVPQAEQSGTWEHQFPTAMSYTVGVTVTNDCTTPDHYFAETVTVADPIDKFDLSQSLKLLSAPNVEAGERLTYTLIVRNISGISVSNVSVRDPIPANTTYVPNTAQVNGVSLAVTEAAIEWQGDVISGTPMVIEFAVDVITVSKDSPIVNEAILLHGDEPVTVTAISRYMPGMRLTINDGAIYTNRSAVTLTYGWREPDDGFRITAAYVSNDSGFSEVAGTGIYSLATVTSNPHVQPDWLLAEEGSYLLPRNVYVRYRDEVGRFYGPAEDSIIYDPISPTVELMTINGMPGRGFARQGQSVTVNVTATDDNSGVSHLEISNQPEFTTSQRANFITNTVSMSWVLSISSTFYLKVYDRAGNVTFVDTGVVPPEVVSISGTVTPTIVTGAHYVTLTASVLPLTTIMPITYIWEATDREESIVISTNALTHTAVLSWPLSMSGIKTVTVTAVNVAGTVSSTIGIEIEIHFPGGIYLPILLRQQ
ncbi:FG-GAP-like repeat-containing protein [Anaerolineales bacterium HSG25]|nr:FG-GAP-like repeat-containing protein [Anaerolineales bacterium HSG25]